MTTATMGYRSERTPEPAIAPLGRGELAGLDGLRAISVLMVMFGHYGFGTILPGGLGVTIFFFISGFLITTLMLREARATGSISIGRFYLRRLLRLQPELWAMIAITSVAGTLYSAWVWPRAIDLVAAIFYVSNYLSVGVIGHGVPGELRWPHLWSLAIEEHYYLTYPLLFLSLHRAPKRLLIVLAVLLVATLGYRLVLSHMGVDSTYLYAATEARLDSIAYGCVTALALWYLPQAAIAFTARSGALIGGLSLALMLGSLAYRDPAFRDTWRYSIQGVALSLGFVAFYAWPGGSRITGLLDTPLLKWLGRMSYGAYLWHIEVAECLSKVTGLALDRPPSLNVLAIALVYSVASFGVAALSYTVLQKPLAGLRHRLGSVIAAPAVA